MSQETQRAEIAKKRVVYRLPGADAAIVLRDAPYKVVDGETLTLDIYHPPDWKSGTRTPAVLFVTGYSDVGMQAFFGCRAKEMGSYISWAQLVAALGLAAITYTTRQPATDVRAVLEHVRQNAEPLGIDGNRIGVWACSGNVPTALSVLMQKEQPHLECAVLCYGFMLDLEGSTVVAEAARTFGFSNPAAGRSVADLPRDLPLFIARAGRDEMAGLNEAIDRFLVEALHLNLPLTLANHHAAPHAFDTLHDSETSREIVRQILAFMRFHLLAA